ncbi:MAG: esterase-like activity of phytase family protein, partial [Xanthomonadales bacterium]|nr:esterase-like activity of phytase family protein [Xanthomonadales bacterium]
GLRQAWLLAAAMLAASGATAATLKGHSTLPASLLVPGPDSGHFIDAPEGMETPFGGQVAQGFSAIVRDGRGGFIALSDNGFGTRDNSRDFLLRLYFLNANFRMTDTGLGNIDIEGFVSLSDPDRHMPYTITADRSCYRSGEACVEVERKIRSNRLLTGADLDPESLQPGRDGTFWIGDELGPYLLHFSGDGVLLEPPFELQGLVAENRPGSDPASATVRRSRGFEGLGKGPFGEVLVPMLEGPLLGEEGIVNLYEFDIPAGRFRNAGAKTPSYRYPLDPEAVGIGAFKLYSQSAGLVIERDSKAGSEARFKKIFRIDLEQTDEQGLLVKEEVLDLLNIDDPDDLDRDGNTTFSLPMATIEALAVISRNQVAILTDNNFPFGSARGKTPEDTEFILVEVSNLW